MRTLIIFILAVLSFGPRLSSAGAAEGAAGEAQPVLHLLDYVAVEYPRFVNDGKVLNSSEYAEQVEFSGQVPGLIEKLPPNPQKQALINQGRRLAALIRNKQDGREVVALANELRLALIKAYGIPVAPKRPPDLKAAASLYAANCATCHGAQGYGDGPQAKGLDPKPADFHDRSRQAKQSIFSLYNTVSLGVQGTAMPGFKNLSDEERWALAFYVSNFFATDAERSEGAKLWQEGVRNPFARLADVVTMTPEEAQRQNTDVFKVLAFLREHPGQLAHSDQTPLGFSTRALDESLAAYRNGDEASAYQLAVNAYLEGFELTEASLDAVDHSLRTRVEQEMMAYRNLIKAHAPLKDEAKHGDLAKLLAQAREKIESQGVSADTNFASAFIIILREGLEAVLVLAGMAAFLIRTGRRDGLAHLHAGWILALLLGALTWVVSSELISVSGAQREVTEGVTALVSAALLLYVGFWLHSKTYAARWGAFIKGQVEGALSRRTLWGLAFISFLAVYREVFETVLFYQALWVQSEAAGKSAVVAGFASGAAALAVLAWLISRYSARLPIGLFFGVSSVLLAGLALVFAGKGVAALQAAGKLPADPATFPAVPVLGIYPSWQGLILQAVLLTVVVGGFAYSRRALGRAPLSKP